MGKKDKKNKGKSKGSNNEELLADVYESKESGKPYLNYTTEDEGEIEFASITGKGIKINPKNKYFSYKVSMVVTKEEAKRINERRLALWEEYKPKGAPDEPANELVYKHPDTGKYYINPHCPVENADGSDAVIGIVDSSEDLNKLDPEVFGKIGKGSTGHVNVNFTVYEEGVSMYLNGLQLVEFVPYAGGAGDGTRNFKAKGGKSLAGEGSGFKKKKKKDDSSEEEPKKKKKKKKEKKSKED